MSDLLCDSLKGKISYQSAAYRRVSDYCRGTINYNKKELIEFSWSIGCDQEQDMFKKGRELRETQDPEFGYRDEDGRMLNDLLMKEKWRIDGTFAYCDFTYSISQYLKTNIKDSLVSENYLLRIFAYMDRRVGKRTLIKIKDEVAALPEWVQQFYRIRCEAEGLDFKDKLV